MFLWAGNWMVKCFRLITFSPILVLGENGLSDRQVSPEKLIRAALLKNRFADTILKFREPFDKVCSFICTQTSAFTIVNVLFNVCF